MIRNRTEHSTVPVIINRFEIGLVTNRSPLHVPVVNGTPYVNGDALIDGLNTEITNDNTLARRPGWPVFCSSPIPSGTPLGFAQLRTDSVTKFLDTTTDVFQFFDNSISSVYTKNTTAQSYFQQVANHLYWADGTNARRLFIGLDGFSTAEWGIDAPANAPGVSSVISSANPQWAASTFYNPSLLILDSNSNLQKLTTAGTTGGSEPSWATTPGATTNDGSAVWTCQGSSVRQTSHVYAANSVIRVSYSRTVHVQVWNPTIHEYQTIISTVNYDDEFTTFAGGTSSSTATNLITWIPGAGSTVSDGSVTWTNLGKKITWSTIGATTLVATDTYIVDSNGNQQNIVTPGKTGSSQPTWKTNIGDLTTDGTAVWSNAAVLDPQNTAAWTYLYVYRQSQWDNGESWYHVSAASPVSTSIIKAAGAAVSVSGVGSLNQAVTNVDIYRTKQGGSEYFFLGTVTNPLNAGSWSFIDTTADALLDVEQTMTTVPLNLPPPDGATLVSFFQGRVWVTVGSKVYFDGGGDITNGDPHQSFPLANVFEYPGTVTALIPTSQGLIVQLADQSYIIKGGPSTLTFYSQPLLNRTGVLSQNCVQQDQDIVFELTSQQQGIAFSSQDFQEFGNNVTDTLQAFPPVSSYLAIHRNGVDVGIFISNNTNSIIRFNPVTGAWSPVAQVAAGVGPLASLADDIGYVLLTTINGYICKRDLGTFTDGQSAATYSAFGTIGSLEVSAMSQPTKALRHVFARTTSTGNRSAVSMLQNSTQGTFSDIPRQCSVPALLDNTAAQATSIRQDRYDLLGISTGLVALDRFNHFQIKFSWAPENQKNELINFSVGDTAQ